MGFVCLDLNHLTEATCGRGKQLQVSASLFIRSCNLPTLEESTRHVTDNSGMETETTFTEELEVEGVIDTSTSVKSPKLPKISERGDLFIVVFLTDSKKNNKKYVCNIVELLRKKLRSKLEFWKVKEKMYLFYLFTNR